MLIGAIMHAATVIAGGKPNDSLAKNLKLYKNIFFPEEAVAMEEKAAVTEAILAEEFKRGPMKVQSLEYGRKKQKKSKRR